MRNPHPNLSPSFREWGIERQNKMGGGRLETRPEGKHPESLGLREPFTRFARGPSCVGRMMDERVWVMMRLKDRTSCDDVIFPQVLEENSFS